MRNQSVIDTNKVKGDQHHIHRDLILEAQNGNNIAIERLYKLYAGAMYNVCRRMLNDDEEAKDVLQDSFVQAFQKISKLREINTFSAWIKRIVVNNCINTIRKRKLVTVDIDNENVDVEEDHDDYDYNKYELRKVMKAIDNLSDGCKTVLNMYLFEGYDHKEIGQILKISKSASKAQYCKAKIKIRKMLDDKTQSYAG